MKINALGLTTESSDGDILDVYFPYIEFGKDKNIDNYKIISSSKNKNITNISTDSKDLLNPITHLASTSRMINRNRSLSCPIQ